MNVYVAQKAEQALGELCKEAPLQERLKQAKLHVIVISSEFYLTSCPDDVAEAIQKFVDGDIAADTKSSVRDLCSLIERIFTEFGRSQPINDAKA